MNITVLKFATSLTLILSLSLAKNTSAQLDSSVTDSLVLDSSAVDTVRKSVKTYPLSKDALEEEVLYEARDSIVYDVLNRKVYLYGLASLDYQELHLEADLIEVDWSENLLWAYPLIDTTKKGRKIKEKIAFKMEGREGKADSLAYNFKTKKGKIYNFRMQEGSGYIHVESAKKNEQNVLYAGGTKYTTCSAEHPHFWLELNRAKIIPNDKVVTSYAYFVVEDIPLYPLAIPFGFFPTNTQQASSGILFPQYGFSPGRGYFLTDGGYYFALSDQYDLAIKGDIYSYGSWGIGAETNYKTRYKYNGNAAVQFNRNFFDNGRGEFVPKNEFKINWSHRQDPKSIPSMTFSSNVNIATSSFNQNNSFDNNEILNSRLRSSVNFSKNWRNSPFRLSASLNHNQNLQTNTINFSLPKTNLTMDRINPFEDVRNKNLVFLRNLGFQHNMTFENSISTIDSLLFDDEVTKEWDRGLSHSIPINTNFKLLKWLNFNPSFNYRGYYNFYETNLSLDSNGNEVSERNNGSFYAFDYNFSTAVNTTLYGMLQFNKSKKLKAIRHVVIPTLSMNFTPDFTDERWGYFQEVPTSLTPNEDGELNTRLYNRFQDNPLGQPQRGQSGSLGFSVNNTVEAKVADLADTTKQDATKKVKIIESLNASGNYNFFADSLNLSDINMRARTTLFKSLVINSGANFSAYERNENGARINQFLWDTQNKLVSMRSFSINASISLNKELFDRLFKRDASGSKQKIKTPRSHLYQNSKFPLNARLTYDYSIRRNNDDEFEPTQTININGSLDPTKKWKVQYTFNYDIANQNLSYSNFRFVRDLHCWQFSFDWTPTGRRKGFYFTLQARASELQSLKLEKNSQFWDNQ